MAKFEINYTEEMETQDTLWKVEAENTEEMTELQNSIIESARKQGWDGYVNQYTHERESIVELYPSKEFYERAANGEAGFDGEGKYAGNCRGLIKHFEELLA